MNNYTENTLKRWLKRKVKVTLGMMVAFMITGVASYSEDITETVNIKVEDGIVKITPDTAGKLEGNIWTNDGNIEVVDNNGQGGNGVNIDASVKEENKVSIINNGTISGEVSNVSSGSKIGNGINNAGTIEMITNNGIISGEALNITGYNVGNNSGNGINNEGMIETIINNGVISGKSLKFSHKYPGTNTGNGINNTRMIETIENNGIISGKTLDATNLNKAGNASGNGINNEGKIGTIENNGMISGILENIAGGNKLGNGICGSSGVIETIINDGIISGILKSSKGSEVGNGIDGNRGTIKIIENNGIISGETLEITSLSSDTSSIGKAGNGIYNNSSGTNIEKISNRGMILGNSENEEIGIKSSYLGNGIFFGGGIDTLENKGLILGKASNVSTGRSGNGVYHDYYSKEITLLNNDGVILGKFTGECENREKLYLGNGIIIKEGNGINNKGIIVGNSSEEHYNSGNGLFINSKLQNLNNYGVISGNNKAIGLSGNDDKIDVLNNYGLLIDGAGTENITINVGTGGQVEEIGYTIMNTFKEGEVKDINSEKEVRLEDNINSNLIINGYNKGLTVDKDLTLSNSYINSYGNGITIESGNFIGENIIINSGLAENSVAIKGSENNDELAFKGDSIINGKVDLGAGDDKLVISNSVQINGDLSGGEGNDTLTFTSDDMTNLLRFRATPIEKNINIFHNISGFGNINIDDNVTFFEGAEVTGVENINISSDGKLSLRLEKDETGEKATHSLSGNDGLIIKGDMGSKTGELEFITNGMGTGTTIDMNGISVDNVSVTTNSIIDGLSWDENGNLVLDVEGELPEIINPTTIKYETLNNIYQSIVSTNSDDNINKLKEVIGSTVSLEDDEQNKYLVDYLSSVYMGTPYSYSTEISRKTLTMFDEIAISKDLNPDLKSWAIYGGLTHTDGGNENTFYGKNYYGFDNKNTIIDSDTKIYGGYAKAEYGKSENFTTGLIFGGNNSEVSLSNGSKLEGDSFYFGVYGKQKLGNLKLTAGIGVQHGDYKADRVSGGYTTTNTSENYHDRGFNIYLDGRYSYALGNNFFLEPRMTVDYNRIQQDEVSEKGVLGIEVDSKIFETSSGTVGLDIRKVIPTETLTHELTLGVSYNTFFSGDDEEYLTGRFVGGSNFDMLVSEKADTLSLNGKYEISTEKGFTFDVRGNYSFEHENAKDEWTIGTGIGYRF